MLRFFAVLLAMLALAVPAGAAWTDGEIFDELMVREWVTVDQAGTVNHLVFSALDPDNLVGLAVREFSIPTDFGRRVESIPMIFWVDGGMIVIAGSHFFVLGADGVIYRIDPDTQVVEPAR